MGDDCVRFFTVMERSRLAGGRASLSDNRAALMSNPYRRQKLIFKGVFFFLRHHKRFCCKQTNFVEKLSLFSYFRLFFPDFCLRIAMSPGVFLLPNIDQYNILKTASRKLLHCACASLCVCRKDEDRSWTRLEKHCPEVFLVSSLLVCYCG